MRSLDDPRACSAARYRRRSRLTTASVRESLAEASRGVRLDRALPALVGFHTFPSILGASWLARVAVLSVNALACGVRLAVLMSGLLVCTSPAYRVLS